MTLTSRLTWFFLAAQAAVLVGFSITIFFLARHYLHRQADERLEAALNTLVAAAEVGPDGVEWELGKRHLHVSPRLLDEQLAWVVTDNAGNLIARSQPAPADELFVDVQRHLAEPDPESRSASWRSSHWRVGQRVVVPNGETSPGPNSPHPGEVKYPRLMMTAAVDLVPMRTTLEGLALVLVGGSAAILAISGLVSRRVCGQALVPVSNMANAARAIDATHQGIQLPVKSTGDELEDLGRAFNGMLDRLRGAIERERRFTGEASHQLRTPLAAVLGQVEVALRRERNADEYRAALEVVADQAGRLRTVVESLLFLARTDHEVELPHLERFDLAECIREHSQSWSQRTRGDDLRFELPSQAISVKSHPLLVCELLDNLIENALKYSRDGAPVIVRARDHAFEVEDQGDGISEADRKQLFRPFFRSDDARRKGIPGVGLGLAVAARLASALGARIDVESTPGSGSRFVVSFRNDGPSSGANAK